MLSMGDELGRSQAGNNNAWCQDNSTSWLDWDDADFDLTAFVARLVRLRHDQPLLRRDTWLDETDVGWVAAEGGMMDIGHWQDASLAAFGMHLAPATGEQGLLVLFNRGLDPVRFALPRGHWSVALDTAASSGAVEGVVVLAPSSVQFLAQTA
jgi:glycogen operon protein